MGVNIQEIRQNLQHSEYIELSYYYIKGFQWLVRNEMGTVYLYVNKPHRDIPTNYTPFGRTRGGYDHWIETKTPISIEEQRRNVCLELGKYKFITWEDEPLYILDLLY